MASDTQAVATLVRQGKASVMPIGLAALIFYLVLAGLAAAVGQLAAQWPAIPYNIRELFATRMPALSAALLFLFFVLLVVAPVLMGRWLNRAQGLLQVAFYPLLAVLAAALGWGLVRLAVPEVNLYDMVGEPILGWPPHVETIMRTVALLLPLLVIATAAAIFLIGSIDQVGGGRRGIARWLLGGLPLLILAHWVVVDKAATDNLTLLMRGGGTWWSSLLLYGWIALTVGSAYFMACALYRGSPQRLIQAGVFAALSVPLGYGILMLALETHVIDYGQEFSALQFLLSASREQLANGYSLLIRYGFLHILWLAAWTVLSLPIWSRVLRRAFLPRLHYLDRPAMGDENAPPPPPPVQEVRASVILLSAEQFDFLQRLSLRTGEPPALCLIQILSIFSAEKGDDLDPRVYALSEVEYAPGQMRELKLNPDRTAELQQLTGMTGLSETALIHLSFEHFMRDLA